MSALSTRRAYRAQQNSHAQPEAGSKAGRNLPAAIAVGVGLGILIVASLLLWKPSFVIIVTLAAVVGSWEMIGALRAGHINAPEIPTLVSALAIVPVAYVAGPHGLTVAFVLGVLGILLWRALDGLAHAAADVAGGVFIIAYIPLLAGLTSLMVVEDDGAARILVFLITTVASDIGGYAVGVFSGKHPMAPTISPKKSWEGFAGSLVWCVVAGALSVALLLDGPWWVGAVLGVAVATFATIGDLAESTVKRDLGIKDMGNLLPGHGGVMDRLDSLLVTVPVCWALLTWLVPA